MCVCLCGREALIGENCEEIQELQSLVDQLQVAGEEGRYLGSGEPDNARLERRNPIIKKKRSEKNYIWSRI